MKDKDKKLLHLESRWKDKFQSVPVPEPSHAETLALLESVKKAVREPERESRTLRKLLGLIRSQWNVYGFRNWTVTGAAIAAAGFIAIQFQTDHYNALFLWITSLTLIAAAAVMLAFRPRDEDADILEQLSAYSVFEQALARLILITLFQLAAALPLSFILIRSGTQVSVSGFLFGWTVPVITSAVVCYIGIQWLGHKRSLLLYCCLGFILAVLPQEGRWIMLNLLAEPESGGFYLIRGMMLVLVALLLMIHMLREGKHRREPHTG